MNDPRVLSVTQINEYLKMLLDGDRVLGDVLVRGEISNFKPAPSGHWYFTLKDPTGQLKSAMWRSYASRMRFLPKDGDRVIAHGRVSVYEASGQYQLYVDELIPDGAGSLAMQFEQIKARLAAEGLFDRERKKPLPPMPMRIGVITSPTGAAVHDVMNILGRRFPLAQMILFPSQVQGADAPPQLMAGLQFFSEVLPVDVIILGRGGGSAEDLWAFNDESLCRAVAACPIPVISAVGHESDFTICDFVADERAPTPSAAAELAVPDSGELIRRLQGSARRMSVLLSQKIEREKKTLKTLSASRVFAHPEYLLDSYRMRLADREEALERAMRQAIAQKQQNVRTAAQRLEALSPLSVLSRGYAAVSRDDETVLFAKDLQAGDRITIRFSDGSVRAEIKEWSRVWLPKKQ